MKINLNTRLFPNYSTVISAAEWKAKKEAEEAEQKRKEEEEELYKNLGRIKTFALGTTPNFTIDLNKDLLKLEDIEQLTVTFGQFGKMVQREILYFSDNYKLEYDTDEDDNYVPLTAEAQVDNKKVFNDNIEFMPSNVFEDSEGNRYYKKDLYEFKRWDDENKEWIYWYTTDEEGKNIVNRLHHWRHPHQVIRNPKFTYNKIYNVLTLTLTQEDTLYHFKPTNWFEGEKEKPYYQGNPSLVMVEVKIKVRREIDHHLGGQIVIRPQEYWAVADTIEHSLERLGEGKKPIDYREDVRKTAADPSYVPHRFNIYYGDYYMPEIIRPLPIRIDDLVDKKISIDESKQYDSEGYYTIQDDGELRSKKYAQAILCRDGLRVRSYPRFAKTLEGKDVELSRYFCVMVPLYMRVKVKAIKLLFGGSPGVMDNVSYDTTGLHWDEDDNCWKDSEGNIDHPRVIPKPGENRKESVYYNSTYIIDPDSAFPENPMGEYICWYICSKETVTGNISRFYGPSKLYDDQKQNPYYEFLIQFEEIK